jgi:hypothetical protein
MALNFKLKSEFQTLHRRAFSLAVPGILDPNNANPLLDGEFLKLDTAYKMARGSGAADTVKSFAYYRERGAYDTQAIQKGPFLYGGWYEADTLIMDTTVGATITAVGQALVVGDVTIATLTRRGLTALPGSPSGAEFVIGYVSRLPANNNNYLRFYTV